MRKDILGAVSAVALLVASTAVAQSTSSQGTTTTDPATGSSTTTTTSPTTPSTSTTTTTVQTEPSTTDTVTSRARTTMDQATDEADSDDAEGVRGSQASVKELMGKTVLGGDGQSIGTVADVILDARTGEARLLIIGSGGFLGIGQKNVAVPFTQAQMAPGSEQVQVSSLTQEQIESMQAYTYDSENVLMTREAEGDGATGGTNRAGADSTRLTTPRSDTATESGTTSTMGTTDTSTTGRTTTGGGSLESTPQGMTDNTATGTGTSGTTPDGTSATTPTPGATSGGGTTPPTSTGGGGGR